MREDPQQSFIDYWDAVDVAMTDLFGIATGAAGIGVRCISDAQDTGWTPEDFACWCGENYSLTPLSSRGLA